MPITIKEATLKIIITFTSTRNQNTIKNYLTNTVWPKLETKIDAKMDNNFNPGWSKSIFLRISSLGNDEWQIYPKLILNGTTNLTASQLRTGVSDLLRDLKTTLKADFESQGATNVKFHVHYEDERVKETDEF